ncbi:hypothetical protein PENTCL1PPCAC_22546, partial [Pristionchus entomophagus]
LIFDLLASTIDIWIPRPLHNQSLSIAHRRLMGRMKDSDLHFVQINFYAMARFRHPGIEVTVDSITVSVYNGFTRVGGGEYSPTPHRYPIINSKGDITEITMLPKATILEGELGYKGCSSMESTHNLSLRLYYSILIHKKNIFGMEIKSRVEYSQNYSICCSYNRQMADSKDVSRDLKELEALLKERGETLRDHQVLGLRVLWEWNTQGRGGICADEMGLGKTCTSVVHLWRLRRSGKGPFMVVCPLSVINHWKKEIERFSCGELESVCFMGMKEERRELLNSIDNELLSNQVFVIPYHLFTNEQEDLASLLNNTNFSLIVSDEAHTLKNWKSQISELMRKRLGYSQFLLLTGTPIQNDIGELYSLLSFCQPDNFPIEDIKEFVHRYKGKKELDNLREILKKYSIRRKKEIVCTTLPPLQQVIFYHGMTKKQKKLYIDILVKNRESIMAKHEFSLVNQLMHLRKAVAHPYLFPGQEPEPFTEGEHIVTASEKMRVLDALLSFLSRNGHRCLIFSQFTSLLDIVQDYLNMRGTSYERLDGSARAEERFTSINSFQRADVDVFLLSTKAGGVGLTLTAADTVIFLDSDWNPQNDMQAMARCHRIGQTKPVRVIRLIGRYTVEQMMNVRAMAKLKLTDQLTEEHSKTHAKPAAADMTKMLEYGLASLREEKEEEHSVTDSHLERIIGLTNEKGEWMDRGEKEDKENSPEVAEEEEKDVDEKDYFYFEGVRYRVNEKDRRAMNDIMNEKGSKINEMKVWSQEEVEEMEKEKEERKERRKNMAEERKKKKWNDAGYISLNVPLPSNEEREGEGEMDEMGMDEDEGEEISFVTGDLMEPKGDAHAIIIHIVDDSGSFGSGGVFSALDSLSPSIRESYEMAGEMGDLSMGDAHLVQVKGRHLLKMDAIS